MSRPARAQTAEQLRGALDGLLDGLPARQLSGAVERLMTHYRGRTPTAAPVLKNRADAVAYAAYRMPATCQAVSAALAALAARLPGWSPPDQLDIGGGTGAAVWATAGIWPRPRPVTVLDWAGPALELGQELAAHAPAEAVRSARWRQERFSAQVRLPAAGLATISYVLGELTPQVRDPLVAAAPAAAPAVLVVEPGTPEGHQRILAARRELLNAGFRVLAPCPHEALCPLASGDDWCHFAARVSRSSLHRRVKGGELPYEDEKYAYVAAVRPELAGTVGPPEGARPDADAARAAAGETAGAGEPAAARIVRRPQQRKGQVLLDLCTRDDGLRHTTVTKRHGEHYRAARNAEWGDSWPPA